MQYTLLVKQFLLSVSILVLASCGGGSEAPKPPVNNDADKQVKATNFPLLSAWQSYTSLGTPREFTTSGSPLCNGTGNEVRDYLRPATGITLDQSGQGTPISFVSLQITTFSICPSVVETRYYDANLHPIQIEYMTEYGPTPAVIPPEGEPYPEPTSYQKIVTYQYSASIPHVINENDDVFIASSKILGRTCEPTFIGRLCSVNQIGSGDLTVSARPDADESIFVDFIETRASQGQLERITTTYRLASSGALTRLAAIAVQGETRVVKTYP
jgi:hypothetical protein